MLSFAVAHDAPRLTDSAIQEGETLWYMLCRLVRTERTLDCGVSPLVRGVLSLLMVPFVVDSSACGDIKSCDVLCGDGVRGEMSAAELSGRNRITVSKVVSGENLRFVPTYLFICGLLVEAR